MLGQNQSTEANFDTGATGTIITNANILSNIESCTPTTFKGIESNEGRATVGHWYCSLRLESRTLCDISIRHPSTGTPVGVLTGYDDRRGRFPRTHS
jgi:hypothetical protein